MTARFRLRASVVTTTKGERRYATDVEKGAIFELNETASALLEGLRDGATVEALSEAMCARYPEVPRDEIERDVRAMVDEFAESGLVEPA